MNKLVSLLLALSMLVIQTTGCTRKGSEDEMQREEAMDTDDLREKDSYDENVPVEDEEELPE